MRAHLAHRAHPVLRAGATFHIRSTDWGAPDLRLIEISQPTA